MPKHELSMAAPVPADRTFRGYTSNLLRWSDGFESAMPTAQDADYLAHAANAYPELVAALRAVDADSKARGTWTAAERAAAALLAKLGEES